MTILLDDPLAAAKALKIEQLNFYYIGIIRGGINYVDMSTIFISYGNGYSANAIISYKDAGIVPIGFTIPDMDGNFVVVTLAQLLALNTGFVDLNYLAVTRMNIHEGNIEALTTVEDVENYDFTTGWPTLPFVI